MIPYILILILAAPIFYLHKRVKKLEKKQLTIEEKANGEVVIKYAKEEIYNYKLEKK